MRRPSVSVVIPVYDEEAVLPRLFERLYPALDALGCPYEVVFVDDGSRDGSADLLRAQYARRRDVTRVALLGFNVGQHMAILAGFAHARGARIVTLDADLQNPPEEIVRLLETMDRGHDYVGGVRVDRHDSRWRTHASRAINWLRARTTPIRLTDHGCMLRAYDRRIVDIILRSGEANIFIPALAYSYARKPVEIEVAHAERAAGASKYSLLSLVQLNFDLMTGFSVAPLRIFSLFGMAVSVLSGVFVVYLFLRRLWIGPEAEGVFTLFALLFLLMGIVLFAVGLLGEYVGRIYEQVRGRPRYQVHELLEAGSETAAQKVEALR
ncbi:MAG TPA: glycosyltransferase [Burkholderiales bacterium]|nr:glycosyltransferase [Burkholderiales bacterium]